MTSTRRRSRTAAAAARPTTLCAANACSTADLQALPKGRAVVFASGAPAALVRTLPAGSCLAVAARTAAACGPLIHADVTIAEAMDSLSDVQEHEQAVPA